MGKFDPSSMGGLVILGISVVFALFFAINPVFAQESVDTSEQITLSKDLENNPLAQEILQKIEQTKQWIAELEQRNYEKIEKHKELQEKRDQALKKLNQDLAEIWELPEP